VNLKGANLESSNMAGVNLRVATLKGANLQNCDLRAAVLAGADLQVFFFFCLPICHQREILFGLNNPPELPFKMGI
jgi:hypothetical protein